MTRYYLRTLGHLSLHEEGREGEVVLSDAKSLAVLAYLVDTPDHSGDRAHMAGLLWPGKDRRRARAGLRQALYYLRRKTADDATLVHSVDGRIVLDRRLLEADLWEFEDALAREEWTSVLELHEGPFLGDYRIDGAEEFRRWRDSRDDGLRAGLREACRALVDRGLGGGDPGRAVRAARRWTDLNPLDERAQLALVRSLAATGDRAGAFRAYESYRTLLRQELDESPGDRLVEILGELRSAAEEPPIRSREGAPAGGAVEDPADGSRATDRDAGPAPRGSAGGLDGWMTGGSRSRIRRGISASVLALAVILVVAAGWRVLMDGPGADEATAAELEIVVRTGGSDEEPTVHVIHWLEDSVAVEESGGLPARGIPAPDGRRVAITLPTPDGTDLGLVDSAAGETRTLVGREADEKPVAWSPDAEQIVYHSGREETDGEYVRRYRVYHLSGEEDRSLGMFPVGRLARGGSPAADWSPLGTAIAVVSDSAGSADVWRIDPDGTDARNLTPDHDGYDGEPAWSPGGRRIAFVSDRGGSRDVWLMDADGSDPRRITFSRRSDREPVWLTPRTVGYFRLRDGPAEFRSLDLSTGEDRRLAELPGGEEPVIVRRPDAGATWIASVELPRHLARLAPGQWIRRRAVIRDARGEALPAEGIPLDWSVDDPTVLSPAANGWLRVRGSGETTLRVSAAGWRADSARIRSRSVEVREAPLVLSEDWSGGIDTARWMPVGEPLPEVVRPAGRFPAAFLNRGDENYHSGAVFREPLRGRRGLTVEFWGRVPVTVAHHQGLITGLTSGVPGPGREIWRASDAIIEVSSGAEVPDSLGVRLEGISRRIPAPDSMEAWHRYTLQVGSGGRVSILVDGRTHWRSATTVDLARLDGAHLALYGRSKGTRILHGPVRVWEGVRYRFP